MDRELEYVQERKVEPTRGASTLVINEYLDDDNKNENDLSQLPIVGDIYIFISKDKPGILIRNVDMNQVAKLIENFPLVAINTKIGNIEMTKWDGGINVENSSSTYSTGSKEVFTMTYMVSAEEMLRILSLIVDQKSKETIWLEFTAHLYENVKDNYLIEGNNEYSDKLIETQKPDYNSLDIDDYTSTIERNVEPQNPTLNSFPEEASDIDISKPLQEQVLDKIPNTNDSQNLIGQFLHEENKESSFKEYNPEPLSTSNDLPSMIFGDNFKEETPKPLSKNQDKKAELVGLKQEIISKYSVDNDINQLGDHPEFADNINKIIK